MDVTAGDWAHSSNAGEVDITILICTRNRAPQLRNVLSSAAQMRVPEGLRWELVVVDNGSSDDTTDVSLSFADRLPIRVVREDVAGLSNARNRGVDEARGQYICWTDDDVLIDADWLSAYADAFARHPEAAVFGGRIIPVLEPPTPDWFARLADAWPLTTVLAKRNWDDAPVPLDFDSGLSPWGANFAVRTHEQRQVRYEPELGVSPHQKRLGEEAETIYRILKSGASGWSVPSAVVHHMIPPRRQSLSYVFEYFGSYGETVSFVEHAWPGRHHMATNSRELERIRRSPFMQSALIGLNAILFAATWMFGAKRRSLQFLMRSGFYVGVRKHTRLRTTRPLQSVPFEPASPSAARVS